MPVRNFLHSIKFLVNDDFFDVLIDGLQDKTVPPWVISRYLKGGEMERKNDVTADLHNPQTIEQYLFFIEVCVPVY